MMDEKGLLWKKMPPCTKLMQEDGQATGFKGQRDRVTLLCVLHSVLRYSLFL